MYDKKTTALNQAVDFSIILRIALFPRAFIQQAGLLASFIVRRGLPVTHTHLTRLAQWHNAADSR